VTEAKVSTPRPEPKSETEDPVPIAESDAAYREAAEDGSLRALGRFLAEYPDAPQAAEVRRRVDQMREDAAYQKALQRDDAAGYQGFLEHFPNSRRRSEVELRVQAAEGKKRRAEVERRAQADNERRRRASYSEARRLDKPEAYRVFLTAYPDAPESREAKRRIQEIEADNGAFPGVQGSEDELAAYLAERPKGRHAAEARQRVQALKAERMESDFRDAAALGTTEALQEFLERWPRSPKASEAQNALAALVEPSGEQKPEVEKVTRKGLALDVRHVKIPPTVDGDASDEIWQQATPVVVPLKDATVTDSILVRGIHNDGALYLLVEWTDPTRDALYRPWMWDPARKSYTQNEQLDDALAVALYLGRAPADSCMLRGEEAEADIWVWRAYRSEISGFADDGRIRVSKDRIPRANPYPAADGKTKLWVREQPDAGSPGWAFFIPVEFQGAVVPSYRPAKARGSRSDVRGRGAWSSSGKQGVWTVEFARDLDTRRRDDVALSEGESQTIAFAVYDKNENGRHATSSLVRLHIRER
jgi:outer membrane protein assembly factor BamD (BamD/ComL family)